MDLIFAGTPVFAAQALEALIAAGHTIKLVLTQPDRPAGRGMQLQASPVKQLALAHGIAVYQPEKLRDPATHAPIATAKADCMVVAAYGIILPQAVLDMPRWGCVNIHASLLPRWRGAAPIQRAIEAGDTHTGITLMQMDAGLDTGAMLSHHTVAINNDDTASSLHDVLAAAGAKAIVELLQQPGPWPSTPQPEAGVTYAAKISKAEARIDWSQPATLLARRIRAFDPFPGMVSSCKGTDIKVWQAEPATGQGSAGAVLAVTDASVTVACGEGALQLRVLQKPGSKRMAVADFLRGFPLQPGDQLE